MNEEVWATAEICGDGVEVSSLGRVRSKPRIVRATHNGEECVQRRPPVYHKPYVARHGYLTFAVKRNGRRKKYLLHRVIALAFVPGYTQGLHVNHIDGNKLNNALSNLEWVTIQENTRKEWETGLVNLRGSNHPSAKISEDGARSIRRGYHAGRTVRDMAWQFGLSESAVYKVLQGARWGHI